MQEEARRVVVDVAKHLVTITVASIGFLVTMMFTTFEGTPYMLSAQVSLFALLLCGGGKRSLEIGRVLLSPVPRSLPL